MINVNTIEDRFEKPQRQIRETSEAKPYMIYFRSSSSACHVDYYKSPRKAQHNLQRATSCQLAYPVPFPPPNWGYPCPSHLRRCLQPGEEEEEEVFLSTTWRIGVRAAWPRAVPMYSVSNGFSSSINRFPLVQADELLTKAYARFSNELPLRRSSSALQRPKSAKNQQKLSPLLDVSLVWVWHVLREKKRKTKRTTMLSKCLNDRNGYGTPAVTRNHSLEKQQVCVHDRWCCPQTLITVLESTSLNVHLLRQFVRWVNVRQWQGWHDPTPSCEHVSSMRWNLFLAKNCTLWSYLQVCKGSATVHEEIISIHLSI